MRRHTDGFTIVEVLIAIIMLSIGVLALSSGAGSVTRMVRSGQNKSNVYSQLISKMDSLRALARNNCTLPTPGTWSGPYGVTGAWRVATNGDRREIEMIASYRTGRGVPRRDTVFATIYCP